MRHLPAVLAAALTLFSAATAANDARGDPAAFSFVAIGDTGWPSTSPERHIRMRSTLRAIQKLCETRGCDFGVSLGDNIYEMDVPDATMQEVFGTFDMLPMPFFAVLGNHDFGADGSDSRLAERQMRFIQNMRNARLAMPNWYYRVCAPIGASARSCEGKTALFLALDSATSSNQKARTANDPHDEFLEHDAKDLRKKQQLDWVRRTLQDQRALPWKFAFFHHPHEATNYPRHQPSGGEKHWHEFVKQELCGKVHFIFAGHFHHMEFREPASCGATRLIISGAGGDMGHYARPITQPDERRIYPDANALQPTMGGFFWIGVQRDEITVAAYVTAQATPGAWQSGFPVHAFERTLRRFELMAP
jgi:hypothetical protein